MAFIKSEGIVFGNGTELLSKYGIIPQNSTQIFYQSSAPTGWSQVTFHDPPTNSQSVNNKALRVISDVGGGFGGVRPFTTVFPATTVSISTNVTLGGTVGATTLNLTQLPIHAHGAGSSFANFAGSAGSSPFRQEVRVPLAYSFRSSYRQIVNQRTLVNFRQPTTVRQPQYYRQPRTYQQPTNSQQPRNRRYPFTSSVRNPYNAFVPFRQPRTYQRPYNRRVPYAVFYFTPQQNPRLYIVPGNPFRSPFRGRRRNYQNPGVNPTGFNNVRRPSTRIVYGNRRQPRSYGIPIPYRVNSFTYQPRRQPVVVNNQAPSSYRRPYAFGTPINARAVVNFRAVVNQRNPAYYRQPRAYRVAVRYPVVNNVRYATRVLAPGGTIRSTDQNGPSTSSIGGGQSHTHPFTGSVVSLSGSVDLRLQYIDVIICKFD